MAFFIIKFDLLMPSAAVLAVFLAALKRRKEESEYL